jgi:hypothetical protein
MPLIATTKNNKEINRMFIAGDGMLVWWVHERNKDEQASRAFVVE